MTSQKKTEIDSINDDFKKAHEPTDKGPKELKELSETQLLLLSTIIYNVDFTKYQGRTFKYVMNDITIDEIMKNGNTPQAMNKSEWQDIINTIKADTVLMEFKIGEAADRNVDRSPVKLGEVSDGLRAAVFTHKDYDPTLVFRGTGAKEWEDNGVAATQALSPQQLEALAYFNSLDSKKYKNMVVTGHSKGGNKAMVVGALAAEGAVRRVVSFEGQGVSNEFLKSEKTLQQYIDSDNSFSKYFIGNKINSERLNTTKTIGSLVRYGLDPKKYPNRGLIDNRDRITSIWSSIIKVTI